MAKAKAKVKPVGIQDLVEQILGQMVFAAGSGSGGQWVSMEAVGEIRRYFRGPVLGVIGGKAKTKGVQSWRKEAAYILHYMDTIGRVAAQESVAAGQYWIDAETMAKAIKLVVEKVNDKTPLAGKWCGA